MRKVQLRFGVREQSLELCMAEDLTCCLAKASTEMFRVSKNRTTVGITTASLMFLDMAIALTMITLNNCLGKLGWMLIPLLITCT